MWYIKIMDSKSADTMIERARMTLQAEFKDALELVNETAFINDHLDLRQQNELLVSMLLALGWQQDEFYDVYIAYERMGVEIALRDAKREVYGNAAVG